ncbi:permease prefix domain 2-containing transporter [Spirosoma sp. KNUC1025]|uniref:permease prefix domain 2-containing transporter n=1 Tax=Spirosoma sp. KNUC1025 TaxID=2894082 RepID=UPI001E5AD4B0|nr:permease prefix domain 2-containing transporter [Spirosoma sp. KNUC1025]UFH57780.1 permease prefix domain 2-containing transporter [Spirosoma sp. KNUC1025]
MAIKRELKQPPRWADRLLEWFVAPHLREDLQGDLYEVFQKRVTEVGTSQAGREYTWAVLHYLRPFFYKRKPPIYPRQLINRNTYHQPYLFSLTMIRNYLTIAWRNALTHKVATLINLVGFVLGLLSCLLIWAYVSDELAYDRFHRKADRIVLFQQYENSPTSGGKFATDFKSRFTQVTDAVRLTRLKPLVAAGQRAFHEPNFWLVDPAVFDVFTLPLIKGNLKTALTEQYSVVLSQTTARKYFGKANPMGQLLRLNNKVTLHVTGVLDDLPTTSHLKLDFLVPYLNANELAGYDVTTNYWGGGDTWTYLLLAPGTAVSDLQAQFPAYIKQLNDPNAGVWKLNLVPLTDLYLRTNLVATNRLQYVYVFSLVALLILGLACFNYVNLATARATGRAKEVGVRKVLGSSFGQLWGQFMGETGGMLLVAVLLAGLIAGLILPYFNRLADKQLSFQLLFTGSRLVWLGAGSLIVALLAGSYPAFILSSARPIAALKGNSTRTGKRSWIRQTLIVGQFTVSVVMIVATLVVYYQLQYLRTKDVGYQREQVLTMDLRDAPNESKEYFKQQVLMLPGVEAATRAFGLPGSSSVRGEKLVSDYVPKGSQTGGINRLTADGDYLKTFGIKLLEGRNLDPNRLSDRGAFLVNQAAMKFFGWQTSKGKMTGYYTYAYDPTQPGVYREVPQRGEVVGVIEDYNYANLKQSVAPLLITLNDGWEGQLAIRLRGDRISSTLQQLQQRWQAQFPGKPFEYEFLDDSFNRTYQTEARTGQVFGWFAALAIFISSLGLFGLATFTAEQRTREIGIRKVLGASVSSVVSLLSKDFLKLILISIFLASPLAWYAMHRWLGDFAYKITIEWWIFVLAGLLAVGIALLTVGYQSIKAALMNPVKSLRSE